MMCFDAPNVQLAIAVSRLRMQSIPGPRVVQFLRTMKIVVDSFRVYWQNIFCCFDVRRYLSWIEGLTTNQYVGGSNPSRRTICHPRSEPIFRL